MVRYPVRSFEDASIEFISRANRAQYSDVLFQSILDDDITDVNVPSMQDTMENEGWSK